MSVNVNITLNDEVFANLGDWCDKNGKIRRSTAISFIVTQWLRSQTTIQDLGKIMKQVQDAQKVITDQQNITSKP